MICDRLGVDLWSIHGRLGRYPLRSRNHLRSIRVESGSIWIDLADG